MLRDILIRSLKKLVCLSIKIFSRLNRPTINNSVLILLNSVLYFNDFFKTMHSELIENKILK